ncbi:hypothetical protein L1276_002673 [Flavobacterium sp. HSC-32F16]|nr:hypothetical protein [Flavobacterium sp. HSC-32F16]
MNLHDLYDENIYSTVRFLLNQNELPDLYPHKSGNFSNT